ncbi:MAG: serine hydrolase domain-containing protein [Dehalococcoidia bacterium]|jgi:CubicO group peptidase (beta-lactamase class C family)
MEIGGFCDPRFEPVRKAFADNFSAHGEIGAAVGIAFEGEVVADLWAGHQDAARTTTWAEDTIVNVWSVGKAVTAVCLLQLVERGLVELDQPVARYWPEFAQGGKAGVTVRTLMAHQAGLPAVSKPLPAGYNLTNWDGMCAELAAQAPFWEPGTKFGYHTNTFGFLLGEIVRSVDGRPIDQYLRDEIAGPLGASFHFGFGPELDALVADWVPYVPAPGEASERPWLEKDPATLEGVELARVLAYRNPPGSPEMGVNSRVWRASVYPSTSGHGNARAFARVFGALACGGDFAGTHVLAQPLIEEALKVHADGEDVILGRPNRFGLGFQLTNPGVRPLGPGPRSFGHYGNGAVLGFADPDNHLAFGYVCNRAGRSWRDPRNIALVDAAYASIGM